MAARSGLNKALDTAHKVTVAVLATSAAYFTVEILRATWAIQEAKFEARQAAKQQGGSGGSGSAPAAGAAAAPPGGGSKA
jgi:hypothetical protein